MTGAVTPYGLVFAGVAVAVLPLAPLPGATYLQGWLRARQWAALSWYVLALAGSLWAALALASRMPQLQWALGLGLALSWWFLATAPPPAKQATPPQPESSTPGGKADA